MKFDIGGTEGATPFLLKGYVKGEQLVGVRRRILCRSALLLLSWNDAVFLGRGECEDNGWRAEGRCTCTSRSGWWRSLGYDGFFFTTRRDVVGVHDRPPHNERTLRMSSALKTSHTPSDASTSITSHRGSKSNSEISGS